MLKSENMSFDESQLRKAKKRKNNNKEENAKHTLIDIEDP